MAANVEIPDLAASEERRTQFGNRFLVDSSKVFEHNAWDNIEWDKEQEEAAIKIVEQNTSIKLPTDIQEKYNCEPNQYWNSFYMQHNNRFFKDRHWLFTEFPELLVPSATNSCDHPNDRNNINKDQLNVHKTPTEIVEYPGYKATKRILEVGCGVGNTVFPILETNNDPELFVYCCDFSDVAINLVKEHVDYQHGRCHGFVCDVTEDQDFPFPFESLDVILLIFVLSAIHPDKFQETIQRLIKYLKPGGRILFRDYGRYDMAQLRFKKGKCLAENFYVRGDGTRCYFFTEEEVKTLFTQEGLVEEQSYVDRRLQVNRGRQLKMYRIWLQGKFRKPKKSTEEFENSATKEF
ncbi:methyltransferase-like protein 2 [Dendronephthya gigantea]|uniref:methyltransferase-like protein 2 n=1 Tax=Dendronephthya gigantea TaxID=151771 RepID=UPI00106CB579|nr:methyltransferase-like protein 2 [Dendronephthya gigantea]XP_028394706.1 methyltransferase-like protein 2 [Dendronephthya gigantea]